MHGEPISLAGAIAAAELPAVDAQTPHTDLDAYGREYLAAARRADAKVRFDADCPREYVETDFNDARLAAYGAALATVLAWKWSSRGLLLAGPSGRGKTRSLFALYRRLACEELRDVRFYYAGDWFSTLQGHVKYGHDDARGWVEAVAKRDVVMIDDLGKEALVKGREEWAQGWFFRFLDLRLGAGLPLIVTTNLNAVEMAGGEKNAVKNDPLIRRLRDLCEVVKF